MNTSTRDLQQIQGQRSRSAGVRLPRRGGRDATWLLRIVNRPEWNAPPSGTVTGGRRTS